MPAVWFSLGSNRDRERCIRGGLAALEESFGPLRLSSLYETPAQGFAGEPFYNLVAGGDTGQPVGRVQTRLREIEDRFQRDRTGPRFGPRTLDIDLLLYGDLTGEIDGVHLPRAEIYRYAFVLGPLAEVAGDLILPGDGRRVAELWAAFPPHDRLLRRIAPGVTVQPPPTKIPSPSGRGAG